MVLAGRLDSEEEQLLRAPGLQGIVRHVGALPRGGALALQRAADVLLLITSRNAGEATGKLFEYLGAERPILALAEGNEAASVIAATGTGRCVPPDDAPAIAAALSDVVAGRLERHVDSRALERYMQPGPARIVAEQIEHAIRAASTDRRGS